MKFYVCETCGNFVGMIFESGAPMSCCGKMMKEFMDLVIDYDDEKIRGCSDEIIIAGNSL